MICRALVLFMLGVAILATSTAAHGQSGGSSTALCATADAAFERGWLAEARDGFMDVLASDPQAECAIEGLRKVTRAVRSEERFCAEGDKLAKGGEKQQAEARQRYAAAMEQNVKSDCAAKGLGLADDPDSSGDEKNGVAHAEEDVSNVLLIIGKSLLALVVAAGIVALIWSLVRRWRNPTLTVDAYADGAVDAKVGAAVAALTEKRLIELSRRGHKSNDPYQLDVAVADVELVAENESLATAMGGLAEESQFKLAAAVLGLIDRHVGTHLVAKGQLAPKGGQGRGVLLALEAQGNGLRASTALWNPKKITVPADAKDTDPSPYYELADEAASWVQFESARSLDARVGLITGDANSFTALVQGIEKQRAEQPEAAAEQCAQALLLDRENVAALYNLSGLVARLWGRYDVAVALLIRAEAILRRRHEEGV